MSFITNEHRPLLLQLKSRVGPLSRVTVFSPYVHADALHELACHDQIVVIPSSAEDRQLQGKEEEWKRLVRNTRVFAADGGVFTHAKLYLLSGGNGAVLAAGSANCTRAGLLEPAGARLGPRVVPAESLVVVPMSRGDARSLSKQLRSQLERVARVEPVVSGDVEEAPVPLLMAWGQTDKSLSLLLIGRARPKALPVLLRHGQVLERLPVQAAADGSHFVAVPKATAWTAAVLNGEIGWTVRWAHLSAEITFLALGDVADDVASLWGGVPVSGVERKGRMPSRGRSGGSGEPEEPRPSLDEFERRSRWVADALESELTSSFPGREDQFLGMWEHHRTLDVPGIPEQSTEGCGLFLAARLLALLDRRRSSLTEGFERLRTELESELRHLRASLARKEQKAVSRPGRDWRGPHLWALGRSR